MRTLNLTKGILAVTAAMVLFTAPTMADIDVKDRMVERRAIEAFYNLEVTPAAHLTMNVQVIDSALESVDTATTVSFRLQLDF